jgi:hypothetical protein
VARLVQIFDRPCCGGPSAAAQLADSLRERVAGDAVEIEYHDLAQGGGRNVRVPGALIAHLTGGGPLPVIAVDGALVATGTLPSLLDALDLANGRSPRKVAKLAAAGGNDTGGHGCC